MSLVNLLIELIFSEKIVIMLVPSFVTEISPFISHLNSFLKHPLLTIVSKSKGYNFRKYGKKSLTLARGLPPTNAGAKIYDICSRALIFKLRNLHVLSFL